MNSSFFLDAQRKMNQVSPSGLSSMLGGPGGSTAEDARLALFQSLAADSQAQNLLLNNRNLTFTTQDAAQRSVMEVLARHSGPTTDAAFDEELAETKRKLEQAAEEPNTKRQRVAITDLTGVCDDNKRNGPAPVAASEEGLAYFNDYDVLSGRGGGTNVHPGNRHFRDLINLHRRAYLKARKNDKPAISRAIVRAVRENNGRFLKRDEKTGLWFEIGDDAAREKTSQALRQRAPEMRKILFESEREQARQEAEEQLRQQQQLLASGLGGNFGGGPSMGGNPSAADIMQANLMSSMGYSQAQQQQQSFNPLLAMQSLNKSAGLPGGAQMNQGSGGGSDSAYTMNNNLMALLQGGNRFGAANGAA